MTTTISVPNETVIGELGSFEISILPQEGESSEGTSTKVKIEIKTKEPEDLLPKLEVLGFKVTNFNDANSFTGIIDRESLTQIIPFASQVFFSASLLDANSEDNELEELAVYTASAATTSTATDSEAASLIRLDDF